MLTIHIPYCSQFLHAPLLALLFLFPHWEAFPLPPVLQALLLYLLLVLPWGLQLLSPPFRL